jgi:hypothetical protein
MVLVIPVIQSTHFFFSDARALTILPAADGQLVRVVFLSPSRSHFTTDSQSVSMSWYRAPLLDLRPDITSFRNVDVWNLRYCVYWAPSLTRGRVCNLQCNHSMVRVAQNPKPYFTVSSKTSPTWRVRFSYLYSPGIGWPSYTPRHWEVLYPLLKQALNYFQRMTPSTTSTIIARRE